MTLRQHDVVLADGSFRIVLTDRRRLYAVIDAPETALGPLHIAFELDRRPHLRALARQHTTAGLFDDASRSLVRAASEGAFKAASNLAPAAAKPAFAVVRDVASQGTDLLGPHVAALPPSTRKSVESAARLVLRARLGDLSAKRFIEGVVNEARAGVPAARSVSETLRAGSRLVSLALDRATSPLRTFDAMSSALQRGDLDAIETAAATIPNIAVPLAEEVAGQLADYVQHFTTAGAPSISIEDEADLQASSRIVQPLSRWTDPHAMIVGFDLGGALGAVGEAASGNIAGAIGDGAGAAGGHLAKAAAIGSAIGSVIPGVGTVIGGAVGAVIGGLGSLFGPSHGPIDFEHMMGGVGMKVVAKLANQIRQVPRWQAHFQAVYRHLPSGTANFRGLGDLVAHELFPHDVPGKDATTGHADGLAEWFAAQPDCERLLHGPGVPPGDRHQLEARVHAVKRRHERAHAAWALRFPRQPVAAHVVGSVPEGAISADCGCPPKSGGTT